MLILVPTPIGNLSDITHRAVQALESADLILCEDTRCSKKLLNHYQITTPLRSYHKFNETKELSRIINELSSGKTICLISDAGTPTISDPGLRLTQACVKKDLPISSLPGPTAAIVALTLSGFETDNFQFLGFLSKQKKEREQQLCRTLLYQGTTICYDSPNRLIKTLKEISNIDPDRELAVAREITKKFEEVVRGKASELLETFQDRQIKGEIVLLIAENPHFRTNFWKDKPVQETIEEFITTFELSKMEAIKLLASLRDQPKQLLYKLSHN